MFSYIKQIISNYYYKKLLLSTISKFIYLTKNSNYSYRDYDSYKCGLRLNDDYVLIWYFSNSKSFSSGHILTKNDITIIKNFKVNSIIKRYEYKNIYLDIINDLKLKEKEYLLK